MTFQLAIADLTPNHLWALLTAAEHPERILLDDTVQHGRYQLHTPAVHELYRDHWLRTTPMGYLRHPVQLGKEALAALERAQQHFDAFAFPTAVLHHRPQTLNDAEHAFMRDHLTRGDMPPAALTPAEELMIAELHRRALMEPVPQQPKYVRVSAAGLMAIGRQPDVGGLARMCAEARYHNGIHWSPDRHHRYTGLCTPPGAPATTWRREVNKAMRIMGERIAAEAQWQRERDEFRRRERDVYAAIPYELNYYPFTYDKDDTHA